ncbi:MAG TPA: hypothetical protein VF669_17235 [Tepidisphaeraceae bacterium]|jgi:hypothetical protein
MSNQNPSRRSFVKQSVAAAVAISAAPAILKGADMKTLGTGKYTYEVVPGWGELPEGKKYGNTHGVCETADGRIFIHNASPTGDDTCIFDPNGKFMSSWGADKLGPGLNGGAHGMQLRKEGSEEFLYLAPTGMHKVFKTTLDGQVVMELGYPKEATVDGKPCYADEGKFVPTNIAFAPGEKGDFYVADGYGSNFIHQYSADGKYIRSWGGTGTEDGKLKCPHGIWCDTRDAANPSIVVADRANVRLQWFTMDGKHIRTISQAEAEKQKKDYLRHPCHFDQRGTDLLIPDLHGRLTIIDQDNNLVTHLGDPKDPKKRGNHGTQPQDLVPGEFITPHQAIWDRAGNIYCVEWLPYGRVTKLKLIA